MKIDGTPARLRPEYLFDADKLTTELRDEGLYIQAVGLQEDRCLIAPVLDGGRLAPKARKILHVLKRNYTEFNGRQIDWDWNVRQYN